MAIVSAADESILRLYIVVLLRVTSHMLGVVKQRLLPIQLQFFKDRVFSANNLFLTWLFSQRAISLLQIWVQLESICSFSLCEHGFMHNIIIGVIKPDLSHKRCMTNTTYLRLEMVLYWINDKTVVLKTHYHKFFILTDLQGQGVSKGSFNRRNNSEILETENFDICILASKKHPAVFIVFPSTHGL